MWTTPNEPKISSKTNTKIQSLRYSRTKKWYCCRNHTICSVFQFDYKIYCLLIEDKKHDSARHQNECYPMRQAQIRLDLVWQMFIIQWEEAEDLSLANRSTVFCIPGLINCDKNTGNWLVSKSYRYASCSNWLPVCSFMQYYANLASLDYYRNASISVIRLNLERKGCRVFW